MSVQSLEMFEKIRARMWAKQKGCAVQALLETQTICTKLNKNNFAQRENLNFNASKHGDNLRSTYVTLPAARTPQTTSGE